MSVPIQSTGALSIHNLKRMMGFDAVNVWFSSVFPSFSPLTSREGICGIARFNDNCFRIWYAICSTFFICIRIGNTPLHLAMESGHAEVAVLLIEAGADRDRVRSFLLSFLLFPSFLGIVSLVITHRN